MLIYEYFENNYVKKSSFLEALAIDLDQKHTIALVGGGGKTSILKQLAIELKEVGKKSIITTSTRIYTPTDNVVLKEDVTEILAKLEKNMFVTVGLPSKDGKLKSVSEGFFMDLPNLCDVLLVEADGSKHQPIKAPAAHEPVVPSFSTLIIGVAGIDCLNKPIQDIAHRPELLSKLLKKQPEDLLHPKDIAYVLESREGQKKNVHCRYEIILNKADTTVELENTLQVASFLSSKHCIISSFYNK